MRQMVMLEKSDLDLLRAGETLTLRVGDSAVVFGLAGGKSYAMQPDNGARPEPGGRVLCPICGSPFRDRLYALKHARAMHNSELKAARAAKPWNCGYCQRTFATFPRYNRHSAIRHPGRPIIGVFERLQELAPGLRKDGRARVPCTFVSGRGRKCLMTFASVKGRDGHLRNFHKRKGVAKR